MYGAERCKVRKRKSQRWKVLIALLYCIAWNLPSQIKWEVNRQGGWRCVESYWERQKLVWRFFAQKSSEISPTAKFSAAVCLRVFLALAIHGETTLSISPQPWGSSSQNALFRALAPRQTPHRVGYPNSLRLSSVSIVEDVLALNDLSWMSAVDSTHDELAFVSLREDVIDQ